MNKYFKTNDFKPGVSIRIKGLLYKNMHIILDGQVNVNLGPSFPCKIIGKGFPIGEIGFLRGVPATANVTAIGLVKTLAIDAAAFSSFESEQPKIAAEFLKQLSVITEERLNYNLTYIDPSSHTNESKTKIIICQDKNTLLAAQKLRYEVYCKELKRQSPFADHDSGVISDNLDSFGSTFLAMQEDEAIGTLRINSSSEGDLGSFAHLYGVIRSPLYPQETAICTKFIVKKSRRGTMTATRLISAVAGFSYHSGWNELYIDCIEALRLFYERLGFRVCADKFFNLETGPVYPMKINVRNALDQLSETTSDEISVLKREAQFLKEAVTDLNLEKSLPKKRE